MVFLTSPRTLDKSDFIPSGEQMSILELLPTSTKNKSNVIQRESHRKDLQSFIRPTLQISGYVKPIISVSLAGQCKFFQVYYSSFHRLEKYTYYFLLF